MTNDVAISATLLMAMEKGERVFQRIVMTQVLFRKLILGGRVVGKKPNKKKARRGHGRTMLRTGRGLGGGRVSGVGGGGGGGGGECQQIERYGPYRRSINVVMSRNDNKAKLKKSSSSAVAEWHPDNVCFSIL